MREGAVENTDNNLLVIEQLEYNLHIAYLLASIISGNNVGIQVLFREK